MATDITDTNRWLKIKSPLGANQLILTGFSGEEAISSLFTFRLDLLSPREKIKPADLLGKEVTHRFVDVQKKGLMQRLFGARE